MKMEGLFIGGTDEADAATWRGGLTSDGALRVVSS